ncbi:MAG: hypothetical protein R2704_04505 [Microthrixaceae bacterium]
MSDVPAALAAGARRAPPVGDGQHLRPRLVVCGSGLGLSALVDLTDGAGDTAALAALGANGRARRRAAATKLPHSGPGASQGRPARRVRRC